MRSEVQILVGQRIVFPFWKDYFLFYSEKIKPDILIITHSPKLNLERLLNVCKPKEIIADGSNYKSYVRSWEATCRKEKPPFTIQMKRDSIKFKTNILGFFRGQNFISAFQPRSWSTSNITGTS